MDAVQQPDSGYPGTPMVLAPLVFTFWNRVLAFDPQVPIWPNRDRFVLSNGHATMLLWSILHLPKTQAVNAAYERLGRPAVTLDDIRRFRQLDSKAPGHPEYHWISRVETTTGPLGQGVATSVGMAIAGEWLAAWSNRPECPHVNGPSPLEQGTHAQGGRHAAAARPRALRTAAPEAVETTLPMLWAVVHGAVT